MVAVTTYTSKGGPVSTAEADANFTNLNTGKVEEALSFPGVRPSLLLDFVNGQTLDPRIAFTRASTGTYVGSDGLIKTAAANVPRFDFDPVTLACRGWLLEPSRTNLFTYSQDFTDAAWTKTNVSITPNSLIAPDGSTTASKLVASASSADHSIGRVVPASAGNPCQVSVYLKAGEYTTCDFYCINVDTGGKIDLLTGAVTESPDLPGKLGGSSRPFQYSVTSAGNGWYRLSVAGIRDTTSDNPIRIAPNRYGSFLGDGVSGIYVWGFQLEAGYFHTSYIPTAGSQVTRSADRGTMPVAGWYNTSEGTQYTDFRPDYVSPTVVGFMNYGVGVEFYSAFQTDQWLFSSYRQTSVSPGQSRFVLSTTKATSVGTGGSLTPGVVSTDVSTNQKTWKAAAALKSGDSAMYVNNTVAINGATNATIFQVPEPTTLGFRTNEYLYADFSGHLRKFAYYPRRLTNAQLQTLIAI